MLKKKKKDKVGALFAIRDCEVYVHTVTEVNKSYSCALTGFKRLIVLLGKSAHNK